MTFCYNATRLLAAVMLGSIAAFQCFAQTDCTLVQTSTVSLAFSELIREGDKPSEVYSAKVTAVENLASELQLASFKITSWDVSLSRSGYGNNHYDAYFSFYLEFSSSPAAIDEFFTKLHPTSMSLSTSQYEDCSDVESVAVVQH